MRVLSLCLSSLLTLFGLGCMMGAGETEVSADSEAELRLEGQVRDNGRIRWTLENRSGEIVSVGCDSGLCWNPPVLRMEARQSDHSWSEADPCIAYRADRDRRREILPGGSTYLGQGYCRRPGFFRVIAAVDTPDGTVEVSRELAIVGWSEAHFARGMEILGRAREAECRVRYDMRDELLETAEPDDVLTLLEATPDEERVVTWLAMLDRGTFAVELSRAVPAMEQGAFISFANGVARKDDDYQRPVREAVASRLFEALAPGTEALDVDDFERLDHYTESWPDHAPDTLLVRLAEGPEEGDALGALVDSVAEAPREMFDPDAAYILDVLERRCVGATGALAESCRQAKLRFDPDVFHVGGLGFSTSSTCGVGFAPTGRCADLDAEFQALSAAAGEPEVIFLPTR